MDKLKAKIIEANPSIMDLKFGLRVIVAIQCHYDNDF